MDEQVQEALVKIADHLDDWQLLDEGPRSGSFYLLGPHNVKVFASQDWNDKDKLSFQVAPDHGLRPFEAYNAEKPQAGVSAGRDPAAIAKDVKRRCLDLAVPYVLALREKKKIGDAKDNARWDKLAILAASIGGQVSKGLHKQDEPMEAKAGRGDYPGMTAWAKLRSSHVLQEGDRETLPDQVDIELNSLPMDVAQDLLAWVRLRLWPENGEQARLW